MRGWSYLTCSPMTSRASGKAARNVGSNMDPQGGGIVKGHWEVWSRVIGKAYSS